MSTGVLIVVAILVVLFFLGVKVLQEYERGVIFRLGRFREVKAAGLKWIIPGVDRLVRISLREIVMDVPAQEVITRDNVSLKVNGELGVRLTKDLVEDLEMLLGNGSVQLGGDGQRRMKRLAQQQLFKDASAPAEPEPALSSDVGEMELVEAE